MNLSLLRDSPFGFLIPIFFLIPTIGLIDFPAMALLCSAIVVVTLVLVFRLKALRRARAVLVYLHLGVITGLIALPYIVQGILSLSQRLSFSVEWVVGGSILLIGLIVVGTYRAFYSTQKTLKVLRAKGILQRFNILDEKSRTWDTAYKVLPGVDGSSPAEQWTKTRRGYAWLPVAGIVFVVIRLWPITINPIIVLFYFGIALIFSQLGASAIGQATLISSWEKELGGNIITTD